MIKVEMIAQAILADDALGARQLTQEFLRGHPQMAILPSPSVQDANTLVLTAGLTELFAERLSQVAPDWTQAVGAATPPLFLVHEARTMRRLRELCETQSPLPLRKRNIFAPPNYLAQV